METYSFDQLYNGYYNRFVRFAHSYVKDVSIAEDITTDMFIYYWEHKDNLNNQNVPAYILTGIKNKCLNHLSQLKNRNTIFEQIVRNAQRELDYRILSLEACDPEELLSSEIQIIAHKTINKLPTQTQTIFALSRNHGKTNKEISEQLNLSVKSVEFHVSKALKSLRCAFNDYLTILLILLLP